MNLSSDCPGTDGESLDIFERGSLENLFMVRSL